jgi:phosphomethylpyrimidine synthase
LAVATKKTKTLMELARTGKVTPEMKVVAKDEGKEPEEIRDLIALGRAVIAHNRIRKTGKPVGIGQGLCIKVNANIGTSQDLCDLGRELKKLKAAEKAGADAVMDLSTGGNISAIRRKIIRTTKLPIGTVPIYQAAIETIKKGKAFVQMSRDDFFNVVLDQARDGVDFATVHCGVCRESVSRLRSQGRVLDVVSRGGALTIEWMDFNGAENPFYESFDRLLEIARKSDLVLSLGDGLRPGCIADATDRGQIQELVILGELTKRAWEKDVQVMIEGPGHVPLNEIEANVLLQKKLCSGAPFYVLGPLVTDIAPGYDHIVSAIGGAIAARAGADFLCYVTPSEHLGLPGPEEVAEGVIAAKIAGHAADLARGNPSAFKRDLAMSQARKALDWNKQFQLAIDPDRARKIRRSRLPHNDEVCTMCGELCAIKIQKTKK